MALYRFLCFYLIIKRLPVQLSSTVFDLLPKPLAEAVRERGFEHQTEIQDIPKPTSLEGKHGLTSSPSASGKTESAILPVFTRFLMSTDRGPGVKILYMTPLRALNRDLLDRLEWWGKKIDLRVAVRHGDTELRERASHARNPPDLLITTPETLQALLPGRIMRRHLREVRFLIIDEVHELAEDKRGSQLSIAIERLRWITQRDFQVIGLSATIGSPEKVGAFLVGTKRPVEIVRIPVARKMRLETLFPEPSGEDHQLAGKIFTQPAGAGRVRIMKEMIKNHKSVILFTNTRSIAEILASRFKVWDLDFPISIHHRSLTKPPPISSEPGFNGP